MRADERESLRQRFQFRCGYCGVSERDAGAELTVDHFQPRSQGGSHEPENWVYCCHACNEFKGDFWPTTSLRRILHPLMDDVTAHLDEQEDGTLVALSEIGAFHIERLHLNRPQLVAYRRERRLLEATRQTQTRLLERLQQLEEQVKTLVLQRRLCPADTKAMQTIIRTPFAPPLSLDSQCLGSCVSLSTCTGVKNLPSFVNDLLSRIA